jgi:hypothetical protein
MTPDSQQPQRETEGGITCSICHKDSRSGYFLCDDCYDCTRPHTPAPAPCKGCTDPNQCYIPCTPAPFELNAELTQLIAEERKEAARTATLECRKIVGDKVIFNKCPFNGDCGQCFLCDNTGGCIISSDEEIRKLCNDSRSTATLAAYEELGKMLREKEKYCNDKGDADENFITSGGWYARAFQCVEMLGIIESLRQSTTAAQEVRR